MVFTRKTVKDFSRNKIATAIARSGDIEDEQTNTSVYSVTSIFGLTCVELGLRNDLSHRKQLARIYSANYEGYDSLLAETRTQRIAYLGERKDIRKHVPPQNPPGTPKNTESTSDRIRPKRDPKPTKQRESWVYQIFPKNKTVHCTCEVKCKKGDRKMISCTICREKFHYDCLNIVDFLEYESSDLQFVCEYKICSGIRMFRVREAFVDGKIWTDHTARLNLPGKKPEYPNTSPAKATDDGQIEYEIEQPNADVSDVMDESLEPTEELEPEKMAEQRLKNAMERREINKQLVEEVLGKIEIFHCFAKL